MYNDPNTPNLPADTSQPAPIYHYLMRVTPGRVRGSVSDFREGSLTITSQGITINGKAVLPTWQQVLILIPGICVGILIVVILLEYAIRIAKSMTVSWNDVEEVVLESQKERACLVFRNPENPNKTISLAFKLEPAAFPHFVQVMQYFAAGKAHEGKIKSGSSALVFLLIILLVLILIPIIFVIASGPGR